MNVELRSLDGLYVKELTGDETYKQHVFIYFVGTIENIVLMDCVLVKQKLFHV